jgi:hypothetical protein
LEGNFSAEKYSNGHFAGGGDTVCRRWHIGLHFLAAQFGGGYTDNPPRLRYLAISGACRAIFGGRVFFLRASSFLADAGRHR